MEEILSRHGFKEEELARESPPARDIRDDIAVELGHCAGSGMIGQISLDELRDINRENGSQEMCRVSLLDAWYKRGQGATFLKLARAFHQRKRRDSCGSSVYEAEVYLDPCTTGWKRNEFNFD